MRSADDMVRQLEKIRDTVAIAAEHFEAEARMNAALHMNPTVRPAPLAVAVTAARDDLQGLIDEFYKGGAAGTGNPGSAN